MPPPRSPGLEDGGSAAAPRAQDYRRALAAAFSADLKGLLSAETGAPVCRDSLRERGLRPTGGAGQKGRRLRQEGVEASVQPLTTETTETNSRGVLDQQHPHERMFDLPSFPDRSKVHWAVQGPVGEPEAPSPRFSLGERLQL